MNEHDESTVKVGDVIQIAPWFKHSDTFAGCFLVVTELKGWGVQGYVQVPGEAGLAYVRVPNGMGCRIGRAEWILDRGLAANAESAS